MTQEFFWNTDWGYTAACIEDDGSVWVNEPNQCVKLPRQNALELAAAILAHHNIQDREAA